MAERERTVLDVSGLPHHEPGPSQLTWWGNLGFMLTEGTSILICAFAWFYLRRNFEAWPPLRTSNANLLIGTISILFLIAASTAAWIEGRAARMLDLRGVQLWGGIGVLLDLATLVFRGLEFNSLNTRWDTNAYGSIIWFTLGFHATLLLLVFLEDVFYFIVAVKHPLTQKHAAHIVEKAEYAVFVAAAGVFVYALIYWAPRFL